MWNNILILLVINVIGIVRGENKSCNNWDLYKDEKCFGVLTGNEQQGFNEAKALCAKMGATLVQITSAEEQNFLTNLVFNTYKVVDDVWIGVKRNGKTFIWDQDNTDVTYTNWATGDPSNATGEDCVQMLPKITNQEGKWDDENCNKKNLVVCQKYQIWTEDVIQKLLLKERKQLQDMQNQLNDQQATIKDQAKQIDNLKSSVATIIPINFIYVQFPKDKAPKEIWPSMSWTDVTASYAGLFFRAEGGASAKFGTNQDDDNPRLTKVSLSNANGYADAGAAIARGGFGKIKAGITGGPWYFQFDVSNTEVRPKNTAIRVWKRSG